MIELKEHNKGPYMALKEKLSIVPRCAYISATGTGKSYVGGKLIEDEGYRALILVPSLEIAKGWRELMPDTKVETYQSLHKAELDGVDLLLCDEMHHLGAELWGEQFKGLIEGYTGKILGMTATPVRFLDKGRNMVEELFDRNQVVGVELPEAIERGILPSFDYITALFNLPSYMPDAEYRNETTEKLFSRLDTMSNAYSFQNILHKHMAEGAHKVVVFVGKIEEIPSVMEVVREAYPEAGHYQAHSDMTDGDRRMAIRAFRDSGKLSFLYTVDLLNEGVHIPGVDSVIMFRKTESPTVYLQQLGRALSSDMAGQRVQVFDFVANHESIKTCLGAGSSVIDWIREGIGEPERQIVVRDYAMEEWKLLRKLREQIFTLWENQKDKAKFYNDLKALYPAEGGLKQLEEMYPTLSRHYITSMAHYFGLRLPGRSGRLSEEAKEFILAHPEMKSNEVSSHFPQYSIEQIRAFRCKNGIYDGKVVWTEDMDQLIRDHMDMPSPSLQKQFFPQMSVTTVLNRKKFLGWKAPAKNDDWPEEKTRLFTDLFLEGGTRWVQGDAAFSGMSTYEVERRAERLKLRRNGGQVNFNWSKEESDILSSELRKPKKERRSFEELASLMPRHTPLAVKRRMKRMEVNMSKIVDNSSCDF